MSIDENKAVAQRWYASLSQGNGDLSTRLAAALNDLFTPDFVDHNPATQAAGGGRAGFERVAGSMFASVKEVRMSVEDMIAEGDKVVARFTVHMTFQGDFMGAPAAGKTVTQTAIDILRFEGGKIAEHWGEADTLGMMQQLGVIPVPE